MLILQVAVCCARRAADAVDDLAENYQLLLPFQTVMLEISVFFNRIPKQTHGQVQGPKTIMIFLKRPLFL